MWVVVRRVLIVDILNGMCYLITDRREAWVMPESQYSFSG